jgi:hypothetical protein
MEEPSGQVPIATTYLLEVYDSDDRWIGALELEQWMGSSKSDQSAAASDVPSAAVGIDAGFRDPCDAPT